MAKWDLLLNQHDIIYVPTKVVKGQAVADFLADNPIPADWEISDDLQDEEVFLAEVLPTWRMFFDGSSRVDGARADVVFVTHKRKYCHMPSLSVNCVPTMLRNTKLSLWGYKRL